MGIPKEVYEKFTPEQKQLAQEMLDVMHPMTRIPGHIQRCSDAFPRGDSCGEYLLPGIDHACKGYALVNYTTRSMLMKKYRTPGLVLFDTGGHAMLSQIAPSGECDAVS